MTTTPIPLVDPAWLTINEAAAYLHLHHRSVRSFIADGRLKAYRIAGGRNLRLKRSDLDALMVPVPAAVSA